MTHQPVVHVNTAGLYEGSVTVLEQTLHARPHEARVPCDFTPPATTGTLVKYQPYHLQSVAEAVLLSLSLIRDNSQFLQSTSRLSTTTRCCNALAYRCVLSLPALLLTCLAAEARSSTPGAPTALARHQLKLAVLLHTAAAWVAAPGANRQLQADGITKLLQIESQLLSRFTSKLLLLLLL
jgi:hypothetical protein